MHGSGEGFANRTLGEFVPYEKRPENIRARQEWARQLLARYGGGFLRDGSGFYRPAQLVKQGEAKRGKVRKEVPEQMELFEG